MKKLNCVVLGYGDRGSRYCEYAKINPEELSVIGVIDTNPVKVRQAQEKFNIDDKMAFSTLEEFIQSKVVCDFVINSTMDETHYQTTMALLENGYNVLLEKPITASATQLYKMEQKAKQKNLKVIVCHVLRYTPFYSTIKNLLADERLGKVISMQLNEHVWYGHFVNAYVRGKWNSEKACGSGLLLAKCCHDIDLICWLNNGATPEKVSSFGSRSFFTEKNAPKGSAKRCIECEVAKDCFFNAEKFELEKDFCPLYTWGEIKKPIKDITKEEKREFLKTSSYGECVFKTQMDIVDRQCVLVEFSDGAIATLNLVGGTNKSGRHIHVVCEYGEIVGYVGDNKLTVRIFDKENICYDEQIIDFSSKVELSKEDNAMGGHYGGDYNIMRDTVRFLNGEKTSSATTVISDSVNGHVVVYCAEESRKSNSVVFVKDFEKRYK